MPKTLGDARQEALVAFLIAKRKAAGLTQVELAARMRVFQSHVSRIEGGERRIDVVEFIKLGNVLGFDPSTAIRDLMGIEDSAGPQPLPSQRQGHCFRIKRYRAVRPPCTAFR